MELKQRERLILVKIVYYGPAVGGKTTNLQMLHEAAEGDRRGDMVSVNSAQDRTILFDLLPLKATGFRGFELRVQLIAVPGQAMYAATRKLVLRGADGVVFVANSAKDRWEENVKSYREMTQNLLAHHLDPATVPFVLQYNKRDLPETTPLDQMDRALNARHVPTIQAVTIRGEGVLETLSAVLSRTMEDLSTRYKILAMQPGQTVKDWTRQTVLGVFGKPTLTQREPETADEPEPEAPIEGLGDELSDLLDIFTPPAQEPTVQRAVKVALPPEAVQMAGMGPDARANETLVESYAQASVDLTHALESVRDERDDARRIVDDLRHALLATEALLSGHPQDVALRAVLARMTKACDCRVASLLGVAEDGSVSTITGIGVARDLFLTHPDGGALIDKLFLEEKGPRIHQVAEEPGLADVLAVSTPPFASVLCVPLRRSRLHGLAMLYFTSDAALPREETLQHLAALTRPLAVVLDQGDSGESGESSQPQGDAGLLDVAVSGLAARHGLEVLRNTLEPAWERVRSTVREAQLPPAAIGDIAEASESLIEAIATVRSLSEFASGQVQRKAAIVEDVLSEISGQGALVQVTPDAQSIQAEPTLLRLALEVLVGAASQAGCEGDQIRLLVSLANTGARFQLTVSRSLPESQLQVEVGLARRIAELHGGQLSVTSAADATRFELTLPQ